jgi:hypothetical protein
MLKKKRLAASRESMTLPDERYRSVRQTAEFLQRLAGGGYPRVPKAVRAEAYALLRHYPTGWDMQRTARMAPDVFQERMEDLHRFVVQGQQQQQQSEENSS